MQGLNFLSLIIEADLPHVTGKYAWNIELSSKSRLTSDAVPGKVNPFPKNQH
jgi:hypothetical protein